MRFPHWPGSSVFRLTLKAALIFLLSALVLLGIIGGFYLITADNEVDEEISENFPWLYELYEEKGLQAFITTVEAELEIDQELIEDQNYWMERLDEHELVFLLSDSNNEAIQGLAALGIAEDGWSWIKLPFGESTELEMLDVRVKRQSFDNRHSLLLAQTSNYESHVIYRMIQLSLFWLFATIIPLALLTGYILSRQVFQRIENISENIEAIGSSTLSKRLPLTGNQDEFDRLSGNINAMLDRIEALHGNIENVSVGIAHDLKTPLARLSNRIQLMAQDIHNPSAQIQHIDMASEQVEGMLQTFNGLLRLSEIDTGKRREAFQSFNLSALVDELVNSYEPVFSDSGRQLDSSVVPGIMLNGDAVLFTQLLSNLLENSIEHGQTGGHTWVRLQAHRDGAVLQVGDDGPGIAEEERERVFDRFFRSDKSRNAPGNGLGLSLVKSICQLHHADIVVLPNQNGAVFDIYLPLN